ncbi:GtrA family protein [Alicyclobacillus mengziensis]|uniref:GtrA family protein n=1 Tax=Alicyclobacillus mengziensis TaxID=2931921 RepID=A0A9X7W0P0_9BACL|nr:GtrA family protein [Alicyclobacillus mengziensis]QSO47168.1 GtrA family protein [Alicyclobacillus mengziensis]
MELSTQWPVVWRFLKYCMTGVLNTGLSYVVYAVLVALHVSSSLALAIGYACGMLTSYLVNGKWTFERSSWSGRTLWRFIVVNIGVLIVSEVTLSLIRHFMIPNAYISQALNLVPITIIGFFANQRLVFTDPKPVFAAEGDQPDNAGADSTGTSDTVSERNTPNGDHTGVKASTVHPIPKRVVRRLLFVSLAMVVLQRLVLAASAVYVTHVHHLHRLTLHSLLVTGYSHWDSGWYTEIAQHGYVTLKQTAFWPMYPWMMSMVHMVTHLSYAASGILISLICFLIALFLLGLLVTRNFGYPVSVATMALYAFFPTSYYFDSVYTESLFVAFLIGAVYAANSGYFAFANVLAAFGTLTRNTGIVVCVILLAEYLRHRNMDLRFWRGEWWRRLNWSVLWLLLSPVALLLFSFYMKSRFGQLFPFLKAEKMWYRQYMSPWRTFTGTLLQYIHGHTTLMSMQYELFEIVTFLFALALVVIGLFVCGRSMTRWSWWIYTFVVMWLASSEPSINIPDYLVSFPRYVLMLFPGFAFLGYAVKRKWILIPIVVCLAAVLFWKSGAFFRGVWIA